MQYKHIIKPNVDEYQNSDVDLQPQLSNIDISSVLSKMKRLHK
jgi:hypothetical protein